MKQFILKITMALSAFLYFVGTALCQTNAHVNFANKLSDGAKSLVTPIVNITTLVIGFAAFITLGYSIFSYFKGDSQAKDLFIKVGGGAVCVLVLMYAIRAIFLS